MNDSENWSVDDIKNGDIVVYEAEDLFTWIIIFEEWYKPYEGHMHYYALLVYPNTLWVNSTCFLLDEESLRPATEEEKQDLFKVMQKERYKWDEENKKVIKIDKQ